MKKIIIANWKMQLSYRESISLAKKFSQKIDIKNNQVVVCPGYLPLKEVSDILKKKNISVGAQDCAFYNEGAYTGEVSPESLKELKVKYVIIGHSERRKYLSEDSEAINEKIKVALKNNLIPILCIGEDLAIKKRGQAKKFLSQQLKKELKGVTLKNANGLIIAYEPIWAIGNGNSMMPSEADTIHEYIKSYVHNVIGKRLKVIYGGSANSKNAEEFLKQKNVDGLLLGGASLKVNEFNKICQL